MSENLAEIRVESATEPKFLPMRLVFANQLRGMAVVSVIVGHYAGFYWGGRDIVSAFTATPIENDVQAPTYVLTIQQWFNFGPFGVAVFFLISGLVVPISLAHHSGLSFLIARFIRIMPTFTVGASLCLCVVWMNSAFWHIPFPPGFDWAAIGGTFFLVQNYFMASDFTLVAWTLCVEWKFYVIVALMAPAIRRGNVPALLFVALLFLALNLSWSLPEVRDLCKVVPQIRVVGLETNFIIYMLIVSAQPGAGL